MQVGPLRQQGPDVLLDPAVVVGPAPGAGRPPDLRRPRPQQLRLQQRVVSILLGAQTYRHTSSCDRNANSNHGKRLRDIDIDERSFATQAMNIAETFRWSPQSAARSDPTYR